MSTASTSPESRKPCSSAGAVDSRRLIRTFGCRRYHPRMTGANTDTRLCAQANRNNPPFASPTARAERTADAAASTARRASATAARPAGVRVTPRGSRRSRGVLVSRSSTASWWETAGWDECSSTAAWVTEPVSATATRHSRARREAIQKFYRTPSKYECRGGQIRRSVSDVTCSRAITVSTTKDRTSPLTVEKSRQWNCGTFAIFSPWPRS